MRSILITGGAGYIGSHTCVALIEAGYRVVVLDNLCNSSIKSLERVEQITSSKVPCVQADVRDTKAVESTLRQHGCDAVIHFAALKAVGESVAQPIRYYDNNIGGAISLLTAMAAVGVKNLVFSSSATVYGEPQNLPLKELHPLSATNPYGRSKLFVEDMLHDLYQAQPDWCISILRYFNPVGAHPSGLIGEDPNGIPNNLMPFVAQVAVGKREKVNVWGSDYPTPDGTGVRDYIHVCDLAQGHVKALAHLTQPQCNAVNLGTGRGYSVLEVIAAFQLASGKPIAYALCDRRPGDVAACYADPHAALKLLGWSAQKDLASMCTDHWRWQINNPQGFGILDR
jgi:UDP-glucose 4-epimerase